jgi:hypothetical protein
MFLVPPALGKPSKIALRLKKLTPRLTLAVKAQASVSLLLPPLRQRPRLVRQRSRLAQPLPLLLLILLRLFPLALGKPSRMVLRLKKLTPRLTLTVKARAPVSLPPRPVPRMLSR